jgi:uncharacterized protein involved in exopolysaccharide biosynthesis
VYRDAYPLNRPSFAARVSNAISRERWPFVITLAALLGLSAVIIRLLPPVYQSESTLLIEYPRGTEQLLSGTETQPEVGKLESVGEKVNPINTQAELLGSNSVFNEALARLKLSEEQVPYVNLSVEPVDGTDLIHVSYRSESPTLAAKVVQAVVTVYTEQNLRLNREKGALARKFLEKRLPAAQKRLQATQARLEQFQTNSRFLGTTVETDAITKARNDFETQVSTARADLAATEQKIVRLKPQLPSNLTAAVNSAGLGQDVGYQELQKQLLQAEALLAGFQSRLTPEHPQVVEAQENRDKLKTLLQQRSASVLRNQASASESPIDPLRQRLVEQWVGLETDRSAQTARLSQLSRQLQQLQSRSEKLPRLIKQQSQLQMAAEEAEKEYLAFKEKYTASLIAEQQNIGNIRVVQPANVNLIPVAPNRNLLFAIAIVISTGMSLAIVWLRRRRTDFFDASLDLQEFLPLQILAIVPWSGNGRLIREEEAEQRILADSYRLLQARLRMLPRDVQVMAVCSWAPAEGRSSVVANLALLEAQSGRRVLIIDADGRFPGQPEIWGFNRNEHGVEDKLQSSISRYATLHRVMPSLDILLSSDTDSMVSYKKWLVLLEQVREQYDLIILDCPPSLESPDATLLASMSDGVLWVTCPERLGRRGAEAAAESLRTWGTRLLGQVIVGVRGGLPSTPLAGRPILADPDCREVPGLLQGANR